MALMFAWSLFMVGGVVIVAQLVGSALFLSSLPKSSVWFKFVGPPLAMLIVARVQQRAATALGLRSLILGTSATFILGTLLFRGLLSTESGQGLAALGGLFVFLMVGVFLANYQFWSVLAEIFDPREAKRLFTIVSGGGTVAAILFGVGLKAAAKAVDPPDLLFVVAASWGIVALLAVVAFARFGDHLRASSRGPKDGPDDGASWKEDLAAVRGSPLLVRMMVLAILLAVVSNVVDYQFDLALQARYAGRGDEMVGFLGSFRWIIGVMAAVMQFIVAPRILGRFGVLAGLVAYPLLIGLGGSASLATAGAFAALLVPKASEGLLRFTMYDATFNLLYLPVRPKLRARAKALLDGMVKPVMVTALGLVFLVLGRIEGIEAHHWSWIIVPGAGLWAFQLHQARRLYVDALTDSVKMRRFETEGEGLDLEDETARTVLAGFLTHEDAHYVVHALTLVAKTPSIDLAPYVPKLLTHTSPQVRRVTLDLIVERADTMAEQGARVRELLPDPDPDVRGGAVLALCALGGRNAIREAMPLLLDDSAEVRGAAIVGLIRFGGLDGVLQAGGTLKQLLVDPDPKLRATAARALGELRIESFADELITLLGDDDAGVRAQAIRAAGSIGSPELAPALIAALRDPATGGVVVQALVPCLHDDLKPLELFIANERELVPARILGVRALARAQHGAAASLWALSQTPGARVRTTILEALAHLRAGVEDTPWDTDALEERLVMEIRTAHQLLLLRHGVEGLEGAKLLAAALDERFQALLDRTLCLVALSSPGLSVDSVREGLASQDVRTRATAAEFLDNVIQGPSKQAIILLLTAPQGERLAAAREATEDAPTDAGEAIAWALGHPDLWLRACALQAAGRVGLRALQRTILDALSHPDPLVAETAFASSRALAEVSALRQRLALPWGAGTLADRFPSASRWSVSPEAPMPLSTLEKVLFLKSIQLFERVPSEEVAEAAPIAQEVRFEPGEIFIRKGEAGDCLYILVAGEVNVLIPNAPKPVVLKAGAVIGELAVLASRPRGADCQAATEVIALRIDKRDFWDLLRARSELSIGVIDMLMRRYVPG